MLNHMQVLGKVTLHWSIGGSVPPSNKCTGSRRAPASGSSTLQHQPQQLVHFAVESVVGGYVSLGFPENPTSMFDADMILGWVRTVVARVVMVVRRLRPANFTI